MANPWISSVKSTGTLTVFDDMSTGQWANVFTLALQTFNTFSRQTGVRLVRATDKATANVVMQLGAPNPTGLHGLASTSVQDGEIIKAVISLPSTPEVTDFDMRGNQITKGVSQGVRQVIAVHELIHAAGLNDNSDHGGDGIFYYPLAYQNGKVYVPEKDKMHRLMPPIRIGESIIGKLKELW